MTSGKIRVSIERGYIHTFQQTHGLTWSCSSPSRLWEWYTPWNNIPAPRVWSVCFRFLSLPETREFIGFLRCAV